MVVMLVSRGGGDGGGCGDDGAQTWWSIWKRLWKRLWRWLQRCGGQSCLVVNDVDGGFGCGGCESQRGGSG